MWIASSWLKRFLESPEPFPRILERLRSAGVDSGPLREFGAGLEGVVVAELLAVEPHPNADRLSLTKVRAPEGVLEVVCGAKNIAPGQKVPLAPVGCRLPGGMVIQAAKIRGVASRGMLCSARELGLAEDAAGILILPPDAPVGAPLSEALGLPDFLADLEISPNRPDLLSHYGVAREAAALGLGSARFPSEPALLEEGGNAAALARVDIEAPDLCRLYCGRVVEGVKVSPSPAWLARSLERLGQRSINNVVDVTNLLLFELGQPLHAFDLDRLAGARVRVRRAAQGERVALLDGTERELSEGMLVVADAERPAALAGVLGGSASAVTEGTSRVLLESAWFLPSSVRRTARALGISTDSSYRFERGTDPGMVPRALDRAAALVREVAGGRVARGILRAAGDPFPPARVSFRPARARALLGADVPDDRQKTLLAALGCRLKEIGPGTFEVDPPTHRPDLAREVDLIEEVARLEGYDQIPTAAPRIPAALIPAGDPSLFRSELRSLLLQAGLTEAKSSSFLPPDFADRLALAPEDPARRAAAVVNPVAEDQKVLRPLLAPSLLAAAAVNRAHQASAATLFEIDKVFLPRGAGRAPEERWRFAAVWWGRREAAWPDPGRLFDDADPKGLAEFLAEALALKDVRFEYGPQPGAPLDGARAFRLTDARGEAFLWGGAVSPHTLKSFDLPPPAFLVEGDLEALERNRDTDRAFTALPRHPAALRDLALVAPEEVPAAHLEEAIREAAGETLRELVLFDLYRGDKIAPGCRSLAYRLRFQRPDRTLTDAEVNGAVERVVEHLKRRYSVALR